VKWAPGSHDAVSFPGATLSGFPPPKPSHWVSLGIAAEQLLNKGTELKANIRAFSDAAQTSGSIQKLNIASRVIQQLRCWVYSRKNWSQELEQKTVHQCSQH
jgi:hypothetical protein